MKRILFGVSAVLLISIASNQLAREKGGCATAFETGAVPLTSEPTPSSAQKMQEHFKLTPRQAPYIMNVGQIKDERVKFYTNIRAGRAFLTDDGITYALLDKKGNGRNGWVIKERLLNTGGTRAQGLNASSAKVNYFVGKDQTRWYRSIPTYQEVGFGDVYEGITLKCVSRGERVEKIFAVNVGGDPEKISVKVEGADGIWVNDAGELEIGTALGAVKMSAPLAYQETGGIRTAVAVAYRLDAEAATYGFQVGDYNKEQPLLIDPALLASSYVGGSDYDWARANTRE